MRWAPFPPLFSYGGDNRLVAEAIVADSDAKVGIEEEVVEAEAEEEVLNQP